MPRPKRILSGDEYKSKTEKMVDLPKKYPSLSKTEKMQYLPRFYYNNYEQIDDGYLNEITITHETIVLKLNLRPDTAFGYPTWKSVFGGTEFINENGGSNSYFLFNPSFEFTLDFYNYLNENDTNQNPVFARGFWPYIGSFYDTVTTFEYIDNDKFGTANVSQEVPLYLVLNTYGPNNFVKNTKILLFNNNRAKILDRFTPL